MKKIYLLLFPLIPFFSSAQITINQSNLPVAGWGYINAVDSNYSAAITPGGASQAWNYATLQNLDQDSLLFINAAGTPYAGSFPGANLAGFDAQTGTYAYFTSGATGFYVNGAASATMNPLIFNPTQIIIPVPFTYNSTYNGYSRLQIDTTISGDDYRFVQYISINILGDGWGSLVIPSGTHPNTLRIKTTKLETDSIYVNFGFGWIPLPGYTPLQTQTTNFKWLRNGNGTLMLEIEADSLGQFATQSNYLLLFLIVGIEENNPAISANPFPNPASDRVTFAFEKNGNEKRTLIISDVSGRAVEEYDVTQPDRFTMTTKHLQNGVYFYSVSGSEMKAATGKFIVAH